MAPELSSFLGKVSLEVAVTLVPVLMVFLLGLLKYGIAYVKSKTDEKTLAQLNTYAIWAVKAAQQSGLAGLIENTATEKKNFAVEYLLAQAAKIGFKDVPVDEIGALIEKTYFETFNEYLPPAVLTATPISLT